MYDLETQPLPAPQRPLPRARRPRPTLAVGLLALSWLGCSKTPEPTPAPERAAQASLPAASPAAVAPAVPAALKVGFAYVGPVGDAGWTYAHDQGRQAILEKFGSKVSTQFVEKVPEGAGAELVFRDLVDQGCQLIFGTTFGYMEPMLKVASEFENVHFEHATGFKTAKNLRTYDSRTYEGAYLAGVVAGAMTTTRTLGVVGSIPIPEVIRNIDSFTLGAQSQKPDIKTKVVWVNTWFDPTKEQEAAQTLLNQGADVLFQNTDSTAVLTAAEKAGKFGFGWDSDMSLVGPNAHLGSAVIHWAPYYEKAVQEQLDGRWKTGQTWWGVKEGAIELTSISEKVPSSVRARVAEISAGLKSGSFSIWKGPIFDQKGKLVLEDGKVADDPFLLKIDFYVKGVDGSVPNAK